MNNVQQMKMTQFMLVTKNIQKYLRGSKRCSNKKNANMIIFNYLDEEQRQEMVNLTYTQDDIIQTLDFFARLNWVTKYRSDVASPVAK